MKRKCLIIVWVLALGLNSCSDENPVDPADGSGSIYSGVFDLEYMPQTSTCAIFTPPGLNQSERITVNGPTITYGTILGTWYEQELRGSGTSAQTCIPIPAIDPNCDRCFDISFDITYASPDTFAGTLLIDFSYSAACGTDACFMSYLVEGVRR